jgi:hypothetical protein
MSNCQNEANSQLKAMQARLDRIDDDLIAHYAGISQLVAGLAANPLTAGSVAPSLKNYNFNAAGQKVLKKLIGLIPGVDTFKNLQRIESAALIDGMAGTVAAQATSIANTMANEVTEAVTSRTDALVAQGAAAAALAQGIAQNVSQADRIVLQAALDAANQTLGNATAALADVRRIESALNGFLGCLNDVAGCRTKSAVIGG